MPVTPGIITWNRLEPRPRKEDFDRTLKAEIRDALWMLTRQWQFGEFQAEDTGSAIFSRVYMKTNQINTIKLGDNPVHGTIDGYPLETEVEKESFVFDFMMRMEMGRYWERLLRKRLIQFGSEVETVNNVIQNYRMAVAPITLSFEVPADEIANAGFYSNPLVWHGTVAMSGGKAIDGYVLYQWLLGAGNNPMEFVSETLTGAEQTVVNDTKLLFVNWLERNYELPANSEESAWNSSQLEYQFAVGLASGPTEGDVLLADEYYHGSLDWYAFDYDGTGADPGDLIDYDADQVKEDKFTVIPTPATFAGMPHPRWWQMEDRKVDLGDINPSTSDMAKIVFAEFGLVYSNDWMVFPYTAQAGSLCELKEIVVTDCFGNRTQVQAANSSDPDEYQRWSFFSLSTKGDAPVEDRRLFIPPVAHRVMESEPIEEVQFIRDEMANMVWGIEKIIPNGFSGGRDAFESALKYTGYLKSKSDPVIEASLLDNDATIKYRLANSVPENWIPFTPVKMDGLSRQIQLQRAAMPRYIEGLTPDRVRPRTDLLKVNYNPDTETWGKYFIHEDEVPRTGVIVKKTWQRTRTEDGTVLVWLGKQKRTGRGEGSSNLQFDVVQDKPVSEE